MLVLDFMKYHQRAQPLLTETINGLIKAFNETPENFGSPSDETVSEVIRLVETQMELDEHNEREGPEECKTHGST